MTVTQLMDMFENFLYTMGLLPIIQGFFAILAIIAVIGAIAEMRK